ncbi:ankyrin repeat domain-containing protein 42 [Patella vulgata]|uniref:ankyrin repeat domain-containing protein 42 n=1 Tax=Patella vulgata TaxID=6465 RepID=UPI00217FFB25|nr:ankyrin repeat domain-containing protein 42 [Patella vulgata]
MTDLFHVLLNGFGSEKKMLEAVTTKDVDVVCDLIQNGFNVNSKLQRQGGNSALHLASQLGDVHLVKYLLKAGGDPMLKNDLNSTPIILAARNQHVECLEILIKSAKNLLGIESLWLQYNGSIFLWKESTENIIYCFICATPDLRQLRSNTQQNLFFLCVDKKMYRCLRLWVILGNSLASNQFAYLNSEDDKLYVDWVKGFEREVKTLQHYCSLALRRAFHNKCNVFYGVEYLPLPKGLKEFIIWK